MTSYCGSAHTIVEIFWTLRNASVSLPSVRGRKIVVGRVIRMCQLVWKNQASLSAQPRPISLQKRSKVMRIDIRLQMRSADMIKVELALPRLYHAAQFFIEVHPIGALRTKKLKLIALHLNKRIFSGNFLFGWAQGIVVTKREILSKGK